MQLMNVVDTYHTAVKKLKMVLQGVAMVLMFQVQQAQVAMIHQILILDLEQSMKQLPLTLK